ncbi:MAG: tetratricopeptide repeat protein [Candidatus Omnitrophota bacterium]
MLKYPVIAFLAAFAVLGAATPAWAETDGELFLLGEKQLNAGEYDNAVKTFQALITKYPYSKQLPYAFCNQALAYLEIKEYQKAEANFNRVNKDFAYMKDLTQKVQYGLAECYMKMGKDDKANQIYNAMLSKDPKKAPDVYFSRGLAYYNQKKWDLSANFLKKMIESYPGDSRIVEAKFMLAGIYREQGKNPMASDIYRSIPESSRFANDARFSLGQIALKEKEYSKAIKLFREVKPKSEMYGPDTDLAELARYQMAAAYYEQGRVYETWIICEDFLEGYPDSKMKKDVCHLLVVTYLKKGNADAAVQAYDNYAKLDPQAAKKMNMNYFIAESYFEKGEYKEAVEYYKKQLPESKGTELYEKGLAKLAECYFSLDDYGKAVEIYKEYIEKYPAGESVPYFAFRLAYALARQKDYAEAVKYYNLIEEKYPASENMADVTFNIGWCYSCLGDSDRAQVYFKKFMEKYPDNELVPSVIYEVGNTYFNKSQYAAASEYYRQIADKYPENTLAQAASYRLGVSYLYSGKRDEALKELEKFLDKNPDSPMAIDAIATIYDIYLKQKKYKEGAETFRELVRAFSGQKAILSELYGCLANLQYLSGDPAGASASVRELLAAYNDFTDSPPPEKAASIIGQVLVDTNEGSRAVELFSGILSKYNDDALEEVSLFSRGQAYMSLKAWRDAASDFGDLLSRYPKTKYASRAKLGIANSYYNREIISEAIVYYKDVLDHYKDDTTPDALFQLGNSYFEMYKYEESFNNFQRVAILYPHRENIASASLLKAGECQEKLGKKKEAKELYEKLIAKYPASAEVNKARERAAAIK